MSDFNIFTAFFSIIASSTLFHIANQNNFYLEEIIYMEPISFFIFVQNTKEKEISLNEYYTYMMLLKKKSKNL